MKKVPLVSVIIITYNHKDYIKQCLDGVLMQETTFHFEIILGEDESIDGTREICIDYANKHPDIIKLFLRSRKDVIYINGQATGRYNFMENLKASRGKYIALCEGDDYWTDPLKLQKQVDFLEAHPDYNICFHRMNILNNDQLTLQKIPEPYTNTPFYYIDLLDSYNFITTASIVFRNTQQFTFPKWFNEITFGDLALYKLVSQNRKIKCLNEVMGIYRVHDQGLYSGQSVFNARLNYLKFYKTIIPYLNNKEKQVVKTKITIKKNEIAKLKFPNHVWLQNIYNLYLGII